MPHWLYILLVVALVVGVVYLLWSQIPSTLGRIIIVLVALVFLGLSIGFVATLGGHKAAVKVGPGATASTHVTTTPTSTTRTTKVKTSTSTTKAVTPAPTATAPSSTTPTSTTPATTTSTAPSTTAPASTTPATTTSTSSSPAGTTSSTTTSSTSTTPATSTTPTVPAPPAAPGSPATGSPNPGAPPVVQSPYPIDGKVHIYVDLADSIHDGQNAHFTFKVVNGTDSTIRFTRAAVATNLDGMGTKFWTPIFDLNGATFQYNYWYVRTGDIASGQVVEFDGMVPIPDRSKPTVTWNQYMRVNPAAVGDCLWGSLQVGYPGKPNASLDSTVYSEQPSCSEYTAS